MRALALLLVIAAVACQPGQPLGGEPSARELAEVSQALEKKFDELKLWADYLERSNSHCADRIQDHKEREAVLVRAESIALLDDSKGELYSLMKEKLDLWDEVIAILEDCTDRRLVP